MLAIQESSLLCSVLNPKPSPWCQSRNAVMHPQPEGLIHPSMVTALTDSGFSWGKGCLLPKNYLFQPKVASSPTSLQIFFFFQCALNSCCESTGWAPCACRATKGIQFYLTLWEINWTQIPNEAAMKSDALIRRADFFFCTPDTLKWGDLSKRFCYIKWRVLS